MGSYILLCIAILLPALSAVLCYIIRNTAFRNFTIISTCLALAATAVKFASLLAGSGGKINISLDGLPVSIGLIIGFLDLILLSYVIYTGFKLKSAAVVVLSVLQMIPLVIFEILNHTEESMADFSIDYLSLVMIMLVSIIGPIILIFAIGYMQKYEQQHHIKKSIQPKFFMVLLIFISAMNGLVMVNNLLWMYFFWEVTTLCSFLLISSNGKPEAIKNGLRALWINLLGGLAFIIGVILIYESKHTLSIAEIANTPLTGNFTGLFPIGIGLLCFAGLTKAAQFPFQSWLLGAMVAPTPVSGLLHSSTMVKAGVYIIVRLSPSYSGTLLSAIIAVIGGFTFMAASAIAISQRNGKRVLAYSTIANLGLIISCAGIGTHIAIGAAIMLIISHAVSKALLFLCIGTIEQGIGSQDIEDMQGLMKQMPFTTSITVVGMISMLLPPFGVLITKWMAIEASVSMPLVLVTIILGSAFTVVFWSKWIGIILTMSYKPKYYVEKLHATVRAALSILFIAVLTISLFIGPVLNAVVKPYLQSLKLPDNTLLTARNGGLWLYNFGSSMVGGFESILFFMVVIGIMITIPYFLHKTKPERIKPPYLCGANTDDARGIEFISPGDIVDNVVVHNYYLSGIFGEKNLTLLCNIVAGAMILIMFGVIV